MNNEIEEIRKMIQQAQARLDALEAPVEEEWPKVGDEYWHVVQTCDAFASRINNNATKDQFRKAIGDMHRTPEEAKAYRAYRMNPRTVMRDRIQMFVDEYNGDWVVDFSRTEMNKYYITRNGEVDAVWIIPVSFPMKDRKGAELLLEKFGIDNILWACGGPAPGGE